MASHFQLLSKLVLKNVDEILVEFKEQQVTSNNFNKKGSNGRSVSMSSTMSSNNKYTIVDVREQQIKLPTYYTFTKTYVFISTNDSGDLQKTGWVMNEKHSFCMICLQDFGATRWKVKQLSFLICWRKLILFLYFSAPL